jgi:protein-S-isoprenylcysteine O-methyltransferase Ste14
MSGAQARTEDAASDTAGVILLPPLIYLGFLAVGIGLGMLIPAIPLGPGWLAERLIVGGLLVVTGIGLAWVAKQRFEAAGTAVNPLRPTTVFVATGPYLFTRNPMYLGMTVAYLGIGLALDNAWVLALVVPLLLVIEFGVIRREERYLEGKFGDPYRDYRRRVRRWL